MGMIFLIWGMALITIFLVSDTVEDFLMYKKRKRRRDKYKDDDWFED